LVDSVIKLVYSVNKPVYSVIKPGLSRTRFIYWINR